ncbi:MAG: response regulator, partial [Catonella sp.]
MYKVLFAEDELLVRIGLQNAISWGDYSMELVAQADDGGQAFELFKEIKPDVVITDIRMDVMDGYTLIRNIREIDKECAIIVISCIDDFELIRKLVPLKINGYVLKATINMEEIDKLLRETKEYLIGIGRNGEDKPEKGKFLEKGLKKYLMGEGSEPIWNENEKMKFLCKFSLKEEDRDKINNEAVKFIHELITHQFKEGVTILFEKPVNFYTFLSNDNENLEKRVGRVSELIESFLGIRLGYTHSVRQNK